MRRGGQVEGRGPDEAFVQIMKIQSAQRFSTEADLELKFEQFVEAATPNVYYSDFFLFLLIFGEKFKSEFGQPGRAVFI